MRRYSEAVQADVRRRISPPHRQSVAQISTELGIHVVTLYSWRKAWRLEGAGGSCLSKGSRGLGAGRQVHGGPGNRRSERDRTGWLARYRSCGPASLADRRSVRRSQQQTLDPQHLQRALELRHQRLHLRHIARLLAAPFSSVARALNRLGLGRLRNLEPKPPVQRYERERPGDLIHIDVKKLARFRKVGHRITGNRQQGRSAGVGYDRVHVAIDDATRLAYVEVLPDEQQGTAIGFLSRALAWFNGQVVECRQVMSDNGPAYLSRRFAKACSVLRLKHIRTRPYTPRTNGKAERFIKTLLAEWAYSMALDLNRAEPLVAPLPGDL